MGDSPLAKAPNECEFAVVGGGLVGMAIAWGLVRHGRSVVALDEGDVAFRASRGISPWSGSRAKASGSRNMRCGRCSRRSSGRKLAETLKTETGLDVCFQRPGGLHLLLSDNEVENRAKSLKRLHNQPGMQAFEYQMLDHDEVEKMLPQVGADVVGASFSPADGHVNALRLLHALHLGFSQSGGAAIARIARSTASSRTRANSGCTRQEAKSRPREFVLAAGLGNARLAPMVGLDAPVRPQRGQIMVTEKSCAIHESHRPYRPADGRGLGHDQRFRRGGGL